MQETSAALIEQLVYFDNFMLNNDTPTQELDAQLSLDLAAFADDSFVFADEDKPDPPNLSDFEGDSAQNDGSGAAEESKTRPLVNKANRRPEDSLGDFDALQNNDNAAFKNRNESSSVEQNRANGGNDSAFGFDPSRTGLSVSNQPLWYQERDDGGKNNTGDSTRNNTGARSAGGNQLHSLLNHKIEATKRSKFQSHVGHMNPKVGHINSSVGHINSSVGHINSNVGNAPGPSRARDQQYQSEQTGPAFENSESSTQSGPRNSADSGEIQHREHPEGQAFETSGPGPSLTLLGHPNGHQSLPVNASSISQLRPSDHGIPDLSNLPKYPVPPGAKSSLRRAGLSQNQIDLLSALIAQHQTSMGGSKEAMPPTASTTVQASIPCLASQNQGGLEQGRFEPKSFEPKLVQGHFGDSPMSTYGSEYSTGSTMSIVNSPFKEATSENVSDSAGTGQDLSKRKRNTAASARFRIKKKMKEKEMETKILQLGEMVQKFEMRIDELEMENRFLKNLVIEKGERASDELLRSLKTKAKYVDLTNEGDGK